MALLSEIFILLKKHIRSILRRIFSKRLKVYSGCTEDFRVLRDEYFFKTLKDRCDLHIKDVKVPEDCPSVWYFSMKQKADILVEAIKANRKGIIVWCDMDIQFFGRFTDLVYEQMTGNDIVLQREMPLGAADGQTEMVNTGFMAIRCNKKTLALFESLQGADVSKLVHGDQTFIDHALRNDLAGIRWGLLPPQIWAMSQRDLFWGIVLHHANCAGSISEKIAQFKKIRSDLERLRPPGIRQRFIRRIREMGQPREGVIRVREKG